MIITASAAATMVGGRERGDKRSARITMQGDVRDGCDLDPIRTAVRSHY